MFDNGKIKIGDFGLAALLENINCKKCNPKMKRHKTLLLFQNIEQFKEFKNSRQSTTQLQGLENTIGCNDELMLTKSIGTPIYTAPEVKDNQNYDFKVDIYSLGKFIFNLLLKYQD